MVLVLIFFPFLVLVVLVVLIVLIAFIIKVTRKDKYVRGFEFDRNSSINVLIVVFHVRVRFVFDHFFISMFDCV